MTFPEKLQFSLIYNVNRFFRIIFWPHALHVDRSNVKKIDKQTSYTINLKQQNTTTSLQLIGGPPRFNLS